MSAERAQGRGWVRIPASRAEQPAAARPAAARPAAARPAAARPAGYDRAPYATAPHAASPPIYLSLVKRWREAGRTLPGHPDEEWERLISQPYWPGR
ncbi:hypothetical protein OG239_19575 [Streptomyces sp. NBC_00868]|uniref:hypothetical protein n=1 Tax=Streptomyces sp. NBC_00868 TaxID=2903683 RepID=UPI003866C78B|nr:hypothetical protein OG239_19575 [Streptomyces sp. NBC_00868]